MNTYKEKLAKFNNLTGINYLSWVTQKILFGGKYIRVINYHCTSESSLPQLEEQLKFYKKHFVNVDQIALSQFFSIGKWRFNKPGLIITFDDGLRCNYNFAISLLEKYGFTGWFMVPVGFVNIESNKQERYKQKNRINCDCHYGNDISSRFALNWDELKDLQKRGHTIGCHTMNHTRLREGLSNQTQLEEIYEAKVMLEKHLGSDILSFAWAGGEEESYSKSPARLIKESAYSYSFTTNAGFIRCNTNPLSIGRINIESTNSLDIVKFQLSGFMDLWMYRKRQRVNHLILGPM